MSDPAEQHATLMTVTGGLPHRIPVDSPSAAPVVAAMVGELLDILDELEDGEGRPIWLRAEEVEVDRWLSRVAAARGNLRGRLAPRE